MATTFYRLGRPTKLYVVCSAVFLTALVVAEAVAGKLFTAWTLPAPVTLLGVTFRDVVMTTGVIAFPITFIVTDLINEYFGKAGIRFVTYLGLAMVTLEFVVIQAALAVPTAGISVVTDEAFANVFGVSGRVIVGSLTAYLIGQLVDIALFHRLRRLTGGRHLWLRATGSTLGSQFLDTFIVLTVAFAGQLAWSDIAAITVFNYVYKFGIAVAVTPVIYAAHWAMDRYLGRARSAALQEAAAPEAEPTVL